MNRLTVGSEYWVYFGALILVSVAEVDEPCVLLNYVNMDRSTRMYIDTFLGMVDKCNNNQITQEETCQYVLSPNMEEHVPAELST